MSATTASRPPSGASRRTPPAVSGSSNATPSPIPKGATARAAVSPRLSASLTTPGARRASLKGATSPPLNLPEGSREFLAASLKQETQEKEKFIVQLQDKEQLISTLRSENDSLSSSLHSAETRLNELYSEQSRMEEEMAARMEVIEKLRSQTRELEKEKRDAQRRYNEQTSTFEAERRAFYDNELHLKSRIQSLSQARKQPLPQVLSSPSMLSVADSEVEVEEEQPQPVAAPIQQDMSDPEQEPAEMTALRLELSTLSTSHTSLQSTLMLLQSQLNDLKRVNRELQEENESYNILLREKTLTGQFDVLKMSSAAEVEPSEPSTTGNDESDGDGRDGDSLRSRDTGRSVLEPVDEMPEESEEHELQVELDPDFGQVDVRDLAQDENQPINSSRTRHGRKRSSLVVPRGESLANLPITGPGLDLAAELGRAENKDMLDGRATLDDRTNLDSKARKSKKDPSRKAPAASDASVEPSPSTLSDIESLRNEVKSLKDANKALSLYASKIIDRIISQEGFEHVLAADYEKPPSTPATASVIVSPDVTKEAIPKKARPQTMMFLQSTPPAVQSTPVIPPTEKLTTFESLAAASPPAPSPPQPTPAPAPAPAATRASRRSLSFDWRSFSVFGGAEEKPEPLTHANLRPLTLKAGTPVVTGARKLDTQEDDDDRRERERLNATMKLMGIEKSASPPSPLPPMLKSFSSPGQSVDILTDSPPQSADTATPTANAPASTGRFSFFRRQSSVRSEPPSIKDRNTPSPVPPNLTQEALEQADAEASLAALDAHERQLSSEIAKGSGGGYTEIVRRSGDRRSSRRSGSGSTVFSAGMSKHEDED